MLRKLMKYEFKSTGRLLLPLYIVLIAFAFINKIFMGDLFVVTADSVSFLGTLPKVLSMFVYVGTMVAIFVVTFFITVQRFYKNLLGDEGYLMNTLPVKPWQNIFAKLLVALIWSVASMFVAFISILIMCYEKGLLTEIFTGIPQILSELLNEGGFLGILLLIQIIIAMILSGASAILMLYASISLGHLFDKRKILCSFGAYIVLNMATQTIIATLIAILGNVFFDFFQSIEMFPGGNLLLLIINIGSLILSIAYFFICNYITTTRLNLE